MPQDPEGTDYTRCSSARRVAVKLSEATERIRYIYSAKLSPEGSVATCKVFFGNHLVFSPSPGVRRGSLRHVFTSPRPYLPTATTTRLETKAVNSTMAEERKGEMYFVEDEDRISSWLRDATLNEYSDDADELGDTTAIDPTTPPRRSLLRVCYERVSPTSISFSSGSIFDAPDSSVDGWYEDVFNDDDIPDRAASADCSHCLDERKSASSPKHTSKLVALRLKAKPLTIHRATSPLMTGRHSILQKRPRRQRPRHLSIQTDHGLHGSHLVFNAFTQTYRAQGKLQLAHDVSGTARQQCVSSIDVHTPRRYSNLMRHGQQPQNC